MSSLLSALNIGQSGLSASQLGLNIVGNNITNASTTGYTREVLNVAPTVGSQYGTLNIGSGVNAVSVTQQINQYLNQQTQQAYSASSAADTQAALWQQVEGIFNSLSGNDISSQLNTFFSDIQNVANQPNSASLRAIVVQDGQSLVNTISSLNQQLNGVSNSITSQIQTSATQINNIVASVKTLNSQIVTAQAGSGSTAGALIDQRNIQLKNLAQLTGVNVVQQPNGSVNILTTNGNYLLFDNSIQTVSALPITQNGVTSTKLAFTNSQQVLPTNGGQLGGGQSFRDNALQGVTQQLNTLTSTLIQQFNNIYSSGQGLQQYSTATSTNNVLDPTAALNSSAAGLSFPPNNGSFQINLTNSATGQQQTYTVNVNLNGVNRARTVSTTWLTISTQRSVRILLR